MKADNNYIKILKELKKERAIEFEKRKKKLEKKVNKLKQCRKLSQSEKLTDMSSKGFVLDKLS